MSPFWAKALATIWHAPGRAWAGALRAAQITLWWRFGAAVVVSTIIFGLIWIIWKGPWPNEAWHARLDWLGWYGMAAWFALIICIVALFDFRLAFSASKTGVTANMAGADDEPLEQIRRESETTASVGPPIAPGRPPTPAAPVQAATGLGPGELPLDQRVRRP